MRWAERNAWWLLLATGLLSAAFGLGDVLTGAPDNARSVTGQSNDELAAQSGTVYRLVEIGVRAGGLQLIIIGVLLVAIVLFGFRQNLRWAWWTMWSLPLWTAAVVALHLAAGVSPGQSAPPPVFSGAIVTALTTVTLLVTRPRFFGSPIEPREP